MIIPRPSKRHAIQQWHPDKNLGNPEATATFQLIQEANSVLSDARERSWYDAHRDEILRGGDGQGGAGGDGDDDGQGGYVVNVWPYFSGGAFSGYTDAPGGFYAVYRGVFEVGPMGLAGLMNVRAWSGSMGRCRRF